ncbi:MAG TPA: CPBP family intramembrane glutamic endopeptidase [Flavobacterium sp.]|jgi:hypothetical protein
MFIEQAIRPNNNFGKYVIGAICIIVASVIGQLPLIAAFAAESIASGRAFPTSEDEMMTYLEPNLMLFFILLPFAVTLLIVYLINKFLHRQSLTTLTTSRTKIDWGRIMFAFGFWAAFSILSIGIMYVVSPDDFVVNFKPVPFIILAAIAILMIPLQTSAEEYIFRGYLMQGFGVLTRNRWLPLVFTSVAFGMMHIANPEVEKMGYIILVYYIGTGLFLGIITLMDEGLELALGFHAANNLVGALLVTSDWTAFQTHSVLKDISDPAAGYDVILPVVVIYPLLLLIFSRKYRWSGWKEKLTGNIESYADIVSEKADGEPDIQ